MLYIDQVAKTEEEAVEIALVKMRLGRKDIVVRSVTEIPEGVKVRVEANCSRGRQALDVLEDILKRLGIKAEYFYLESYDKITINIAGPQLGLVIGKGGSTLEALEILVSAIHNHKYDYYKPVTINPGGYRENKKKALQTLVKRAVEAVCDGERVCLPVMHQRERKQVHQLIKEFPGFRSRSFGDGRDRRVYIFKAEDASDEYYDEPDEDEDEIPGAHGNGQAGDGARAAAP